MDQLPLYPQHSVQPPSMFGEKLLTPTHTMVFKKPSTFQQGMGVETVNFYGETSKLISSCGWGHNLLNLKEMKLERDGRNVDRFENV